MNNIFLSIIIPCYNEGLKIEKTLSTLQSFLQTNSISLYEILVVDDGSSDDTKSICSNILTTTPNVRYIGYEDNKGKGYAIQQGILASTGEFVLFMDADLSTKLSAISDALRSIDDFDGIIGSRKLPDSTILKKQPALRRLMGSICPVVTTKLLSLDVKDTQCGFKIFSKDLAQLLASKQKITRFAFDAEYLYIAKLNNYSILEMPVSWENDEDSRVSAIESSIHFLKDIILIRLNKHNYTEGVSESCLIK